MIHSGPGHVFWKAALATEAATVATDVEIKVGDLQQIFGPRDFLIRVEVQGAVADGLGPSAKIFCGGAFRKGQPLPDGIFRDVFDSEHRFTSTSRLCLVDDEGTGRFDRAFAVGPSSIGVGIQTINPLSYEMRGDFKVPDCELGFEVIKGGALQGPQLQLDAYFRGKNLFIAAAWMVRDKGPAFKRVFSERSLKKADYPAALEFGDILVTVLQYDAANRVLDARLDKPFYSTPIWFEAIGPNIIFIYH